MPPKNQASPIAQASEGPTHSFPADEADLTASRAVKYLRGHSPIHMTHESGLVSDWLPLRLLAQLAPLVITILI